MNHVDQAQEWVEKLRDPTRLAEGWNRVRYVVALAAAAELPSIVAAVNWLVEVECHAFPEVQRTLDGWLREEAEGRNFGPLSGLDCRARLDPRVAESENLGREAEALTRLRDELQLCLAALEGGQDGAR